MINLQQGLFNKDEFHKIDSIVMRHAFDIQNELGRFCSEKIYQSELAYRCENDTSIFKVCTECPLHISCKQFSKRFKADMIINDNIIYELKTAENLAVTHQSQLLNYLLLADLSFAKLINFRTASVEFEYITTNLTREKRHQVNIHNDSYNADNQESRIFYEELCMLIDHWGAFLEISLYTDAITHVLGGETEVIRPIEIHCRGRDVGQQRIHLIGKDAAFRISSITKFHQSYETSLIKMLSHTNLKHLHWVNFNHHNITFKTITNPSRTSLKNSLAKKCFKNSLAVNSLAKKCFK